MRTVSDNDGKFKHVKKGGRIFRWLKGEGNSLQKIADLAGKIGKIPKEHEALTDNIGTLISKITSHNKKVTSFNKGGRFLTRLFRKILSLFSKAKKIDLAAINDLEGKIEEAEIINKPCLMNDVEKDINEEDDEDDSTAEKPGNKGVIPTTDQKKSEKEEIEIEES